MFKFEGKGVLFLKRVLLLLVTVQRLVLSLVDVHTFQDIGALLDTHFHINVRKRVRGRVILNSKQHAEILAS